MARRQARSVPVWIADRLGARGSAQAPRSRRGPRSKGCGLAGPSRDPGDSRLTPRTLRPSRRRRRQGQLSDGHRSPAGTPLRLGSAQARCPAADARRERQGGTCSLAIRPKQRSGRRRSPDPVRPPGGQPGTRRPGARRHRCGRAYSHARFEPAPKGPVRPMHRPVGIDVR